MIFVVLFVCAAISGAIASSKNRNVIGWAALGFFLGLIGVLITALQDPAPLATAAPAVGPSNQPSASPAALS